MKRRFPNACLERTDCFLTQVEDADGVVVVVVVVVQSSCNYPVSLCLLQPVASQIASVSAAARERAEVASERASGDLHDETAACQHWL